MDVREEGAIRAPADRLTAAYSATRSPAEVKAAVAEAHASFEDRRVGDFVPVLVERKVRAVLGRPSTAH
ncbi:three-helix bundle dimerization domain-containing protein [Streptomyces mirabilis]|uniref:three-helix bundle dimerization domain-containing protein n=1 Tax=Streptomyces mirabilis TaxID=68239 RepID=UPI00371ABDF6